MKIRTDFVTNSSSSSFILAFKNESNIADELLKGFDDESMRDFPTVYYDVKKAEKLTQEQVIEEIKEYYSWEIEYSLYSRYTNEQRLKGLPAIKRSEWIETSEAKAMIEEKMKEVIKNAKAKMKGKKLLVEVEYSDHEHSMLEHEVMPRMENLVISFNNH